LLDAA
jgi:hypothetical protein